MQHADLNLRRRAMRAMLAMGILLPLLAAAPASEEATEAPAAAATPVPAFRQANTVAVLTVEGMIDNVTLRSLERRIPEAISDSVDAIVLEIDTEGGALTATLDICSLLKDTSITPANRVAWVRPEAYSAGAIIALACREIVVAPNATFGDAAPIVPGMTGGVRPLPPAERAKAESPILTEVIDSARRNHYDENLVQSFVSVGVELWLLENVNSGQRVVVDRAEYERVFGEPPPEQITPIAPSGGNRDFTPQYDQSLPRAEGATPADPEQQRQEIERMQTLPPSRDPLTEADRGDWQLLRQVVSDDRLLTVKPDEALYYGLATEVIANDEELKAFFGANTIIRYNRSWSESLVRFLTQPMVMGVLIVVFLLALFIELAAPGVGVFGATAMVALLILIGAPYLAGMAQWWDILLIGAGLLLIGVELFLIPGVGIAGIAGAGCLLIGLVGVFVTGDLGTPRGQTELLTGLITTITALFAAGVGIWIISRQFHSIPLLNQLVLSTELGGRGDSGGGTATSGLLAAMGEQQRALEVGDVGTAETDLRPAGRGSFSGRIVDVQSPGRYIERGSPIRVITVGRYVIEVEEVE